MSGNVSGVKDQTTTRRSFNTAELEASARVSVEKKAKITETVPLKPREKALDLDAQVGQHTVVSAKVSLDTIGGYYCEECKCSVKDSRSWLDHVNSKKQKVKARINYHKEKARERKEKKSKQKSLVEKLKLLKEKKKII